ncbi:hypothetical protein M8J77_025223 [Diaphorina citri]|nr:hypothetical protein M8J77_025223 [Diaphorina citri]
MVVHQHTKGPNGSTKGGPGISVFSCTEVTEEAPTKRILFSKAALIRDVFCAESTMATTPFPRSAGFKGILESVQDFYFDVMNNRSDPRVKDWFLMSGPLPTVCICLSYAFIVKIVGPKLMEDRKPFQLRKTLIVYNFLQVLFSSWLFYEAMDGAWYRDYSLRCEPVDYSTTPKAMRVRNNHKHRNTKANDNRARKQQTRHMMTARLVNLLLLLCKELG